MFLSPNLVGDFHVGGLLMSFSVAYRLVAVQVKLVLGLPEVDEGVQVGV